MTGRMFRSIVRAALIVILSELPFCAAMYPEKLPFAASADVSAEQSTPNLGLYVTIQYLHSYVQKSIPDQLR